MSRALRISPGVSLPPDTVTSTIVVYGGKGMGKTNLGSVLIEELARLGLRWAWLDPLGVSYGLRHSEDGTGPGVECLILGGPRGDIPIEATSGEAVADVVVDEPGNVLIDFSRKPSGEMWSVGERIRFVTAYARRLFQRQGELVGGRRREPLFQVLDEAARYIPQTIPSGTPDLALCVGAWEQLVEEGRNVGIGVCLLTQRSARMSKSVSELADAMFAFRTVGPNSLEAILDWLGSHVEKSRLRELAEKVRALEPGSALLVSPGWLRFEGVVGIRKRTTFDSSATPKPGERAKGTKGVGAVPDLARIRERMAATIERAKAEDPRELRKRIAELERQVRTAATPAPAMVERVEVPVLLASEIAELRDLVSRVCEKVDAATHTVESDPGRPAPRATLSGEPIHRERAAGRPSATLPPRSPSPAESRTSTRIAPRNATSSRENPPARPTSSRASGAAQGPGSPHSDLGTGGLRRMLCALADRPSLSVRQLGVRAHLAAGSGTFDTYLSRGRKAGWIEGDRHSLKITAAGREALGPYEPLPTGEALLRHWLGELGGSGAARMLEALADVFPRSMSRAELAAAANLVEGSGTFDTYLSRLRRLELVEGRGELRAAEELFA